MAKNLDQDRWELRLKDNWTREKKKRDELVDMGDDVEKGGRLHFSAISDDLADEFEFHDFDEICRFFDAVQHAFIHRDLTAFLKTGFCEEDLNHKLRVANELLIGRRFCRVHGEVRIVKSGKMDWKLEKLSQVYQKLIVSFDSEIDEFPEIHPKLKEALGDWNENPSGIL